MKHNFERCLAEVLKHEGGWADHPKDPGGATMKGVTIGTYAQFKGRKVTKDELRNISNAELQAIYRRGYWDKVSGDDLPSGLDMVAFDAAVNSGPSRGAKWLQEALGVTADGKVGPATLEAARAQYAPAVIERAVGFRLAFLKRLKTWGTFGRGWQRRVDEVKAFALSLADTRPLSPKPVDDSRAPDPVAKPSGGLVALIAAAIGALAALAGGLFDQFFK